MTIYLAGKITGDPDYREKFQGYAERLRKLHPGANIFNPAEHPAGLSNAEYMRLCFAEIDVADMVAFLPDWYRSNGATLERQYCNYIGKQYFDLADGEADCHGLRPRNDGKGERA